MTQSSALSMGIAFCISLQFALLAVHLLSADPLREPQVKFMSSLFLGLSIVLALQVAAIARFFELPQPASIAMELALPAGIALAIRSLVGRSVGWRSLTVVLGAPLLGILAWRLNLLEWIAPLSIGLAVVGAIWGAIERAGRIRSIALPSVDSLILFLVAFAVLRAMIEYSVWSDGPDFRDSLYYQLLLVVLMILALRMTYLGLRMTDTFLAAPDKYGSSSLSTDDLTELAERLRKALIENKIYRDTELSLDRAGKIIGATAREVSQTVNEQFDCNFATLINRFRVDEAAQMLSAPSVISIADVCYAVGFGSKSAFHREFRRHFGKSPTQYRSAILQANASEVEDSFRGG